MITRVYLGTPIETDPGSAIAVGITTEQEVLRTFGAPYRVIRHPRGNIFIFRFLRRNTNTFTLEEPLITNFQLFSYSVVKEREDRLVILFDDRGIVQSFGYDHATKGL